MSKRRWTDYKGQKIREFAMRLSVLIISETIEAIPIMPTNVYGLGKAQGLKPK